MFSVSSCGRCLSRTSASLRVPVRPVPVGAGSRSARSRWVRGPGAGKLRLREGPSVTEASAPARRSDMLSLVLLFALRVLNAEAEREEVVGVRDSSVLLDPEITVDPSKNEILWTFKASNKSLDIILNHIPGVATVEPSEQFKDRLQFNALSGALTINGLNARDQGDYTFIVDGKELKVIELLIIDKDKEEIGALGSSVLLDPEVKVDPSKSEIVWTFISRSILRHIPGRALVKPSDQFKSRLQFNTYNGALMVNELDSGDQGDYAFIVDGQELRIIQLQLFDELSEASILTNTEALGLTVELTCDVSGDPNEYQWQKDGGEISQHHQLMDENRTLVIPSASFDDCGMYTCVTTNPVSSIQANFTLILQGLSPKDVAIVAALTAGQLISAPSLHSAVLPDQWRWKTLGALLGIAFYFLILLVCNSLSVTATYVAFIYWFVFKGLSPLDFVVVAVLIIGLQISSFYIRALWDVDEIWESLQGSRAARIWLKCSALYEAVLISCLIVAFIVNAAISGFSATGTVTLALAIIVPLVFILIPVYLDMRRNLKAGDSIKDALIFALKLTLWSLPFVNVIYLVYQLCKKSDTGLSYWSWRQSFQNSIVNMAFFISITLSDFIAGFSSKDTVTFAVSIAMAVLVLVLVISFVFLWQNLFQYYGYAKFLRWMSIFNVGFLIVILIALISWMAIKGRPEDIGFAVPPIMGVLLSTVYSIIFLRWTKRGFPDSKQWWWSLNICNIVSLVVILIALICWIAFKDQGCDINIPIWIILTVSMVTSVITLSRSFPVCHNGNKGTNKNDCAEVEQDKEEVQELQTISPDHEAEPENLPPD